MEQLKHESPQCVSVRRNFLSRSGKNIDDLLKMEPPTEKRVFSEKTSPDEFFSNESTTVTVSAEILSSNLTLSSVTAYLADANGNLLSELGQMYDDGTHGDARGADTIFTAQFDLNESSARTMFVRVRATYDGDQNLYLSPMMQIAVYEPLPEGATEKITQLLSSFQEQYYIYLQGKPVKNAMQAILSDIRRDKNVSEAEISGNTITIIFKSGLRGVILLDDPSVPVQGSGIAVPPNSLPENAQFPGNDKLMIWSPHYSNNLNFNADHAKDRFGQSVFMEFSPKPPAITSDANASLDSVKNWGNYGAVIIDTHGGISKVNGQDQVILETGTSVTPNPPAGIQADWTAGRIAPSGSNRWLIYPSYITRYANNMRNTFFWLGACDSLKNDTMWDAIRGKGGKVAFGWSDTVSVSFEDSTFEEVIDTLVKNDPDEDILTARETFDNIDDKVDGWCPFGFCIGGTGAKLEFRTANADWNKFLFYEGGIVNGDFETGDWTGWNHGGDYDFRLISGAKKYGGAKSAALGRWDTAYHGYDPTAEPNGYEWFYQDFVVPNNVTYLKFHWWMETYDTAQWDWVDAYLKDEHGNTLITILSQAGKPGADYGPYWSTQMADGGNGWREVKIDISAYRGQKVRIYFDQRLDGYGDQQRVYIDDVALE